MKKIALVNQRYGIEVNGGSEYYTRLIAERLKNHYQVEILTSKALSYEKWKNHYQDDIEEINGITVRRFEVVHERNTWLMRFLSQCIIRFHWNTKWLSRLWVKAQGPYVPDLIDYIKRNQAQYEIFIFVTYLYYPTVMGMPVVKDKSILIPTAHDEPYIYFNCYKSLFHMPKAFIYLTDEEKIFVENLYHNQDIPSVVAGVGVDLPSDISVERFRNKYNIVGDYIIYTGRLDQSKGCDHMLEYFMQYYAKYEKLQLILMGQCFMKLPEHPAIHYLGFVSEQDKFDGVSGAKALWLPSRFESLSISVLEAMALGVPVLVNGECDVLRGHCIKSGGGLYYMNYEECEEDLDIFAFSADKWRIMHTKAKQYVQKNYTWSEIMGKMKDLIEVL